jgi:superfamily I DNA/RNA helicase
MMRVPISDWKPVGVRDLEAAAWDALRHTTNSCVVAGPGSGKTEFLAQRAAYLLQTRHVRDRSHILAISFKRDAAVNLADRVKRRCTPAQSSSFTSMTFDAFTKSLVDRFSNVLPNQWRPSIPYEIKFFGTSEIDNYLRAARRAAPHDWKSHPVWDSPPELFESQSVGLCRLPTARRDPQSPVEFAVFEWWRKQLHRPDGKSNLNFVLLNRLAELIQRVSPQVRRAVQATYPTVFIDEFQDTSYSQYDLLCSVFGGVDGIAVTAVGDHKQRIMGWAGAKSDAFEEFTSEFSAKRFELKYNHRSSPSLVRIQQVVADALDPTSVAIESHAQSLVSDEVAQIWRFSEQSKEAKFVAKWIVSDIQTRGTTARDYSILVRQRAEDCENALQPIFEEAGLSLRNESRKINDISIQDLLIEPLSETVIGLLRLAVRKHDPDAWTVVAESMSRLREIDPDDLRASRATEKALLEAVVRVKAGLGARPTIKPSTAKPLLEFVIGYLDRSAIVRSYPEYADLSRLDSIIAALEYYLAECMTDSTSWSEVVDRAESRDSIPLLTVHKSKGLEYDTVIFMRLDDSSWWSFEKDREEGLATFFVGLSRPKQRVIFTFAEELGERTKVEEIYQLLREAGVKETDQDPMLQIEPPG